MWIKYFLSALAAGALLALAAPSAAAQVGRIEGVVKKAGTGEPIAGAVVEIVRTDIRGNYPLPPTKKDGKFLHAGVPLTGTYTLLVSAPDYAPTYLAGLRPTGENLTIELSPGDGRKLTMDDLKKAQAGAPKAGGGQPQMSAAEMKKQQEEYEKKRKEIEEKNTKIKADFEEMKKRFEAGKQLANNRDYAGAINEFNEAIKLDPEQHVIFGNLAIALFNRGATQLNAGQRDPAKQDFIDSVTAAGKAFSLVEAQSADPAKANDPTLKKTKSDYLKIKADSEAVLAARYGDGAQADAAAKDLKAAAELLDDPAKKKEYHLKAAKSLFEAGKSQEAIAAFEQILQTDPDNIEAIYNLGLAYSGVEKFQEAANMLQRFVDKAPGTDPRVAETKEIIKHLVVGNNLQPPKADTSSKSSAAKKKKP